MTLHLYDQKMLDVITHLIESGKIARQEEFCKEIGADNSNLHKIKKGVFSFKLIHVEACIKRYKINPAFFFAKNAKMYTITAS